GFHVRRVVHTLRSSSYATELEFKDCWVSDHQVLGEVNKGFAVANARLTRQRIPYAAGCIGVAIAAHEMAIEWAKMRSTFGEKLAGPDSGQILAFLGAEVVKIERPEGDDARKWGPPFLEGDALGFIALNRGKKSITCDLGDAKQREALIERIGQADIFVHNLRADVPAKFGIDGATLSKRFPRLIYADLGAFGHAGPWKERPGYEPIIQAVAGPLA